MSAIQANLPVSGKFKVTPLRRFPTAITLWSVFYWGFPHFGCDREVAWWRFKNLPYLLRRLPRLLIAKLFRVPHVIGAVFGDVLLKDGRIERLGLMTVQIVTNSGVNYIAARMAGSSPSNISLFNFHGLGTGTTAAAVTDTALQTEITNSHYTPSSTRATGTQSNPSANVYQSIGTNTQATAGDAITEWALFTQAATGGGTILDHMVFSAVNLAVGDSLQTTFQFTIASGG